MRVSPQDGISLSRVRYSTAADLTQNLEYLTTGDTGRSVLLLEGRDRVGGRTYTIDEDGTACWHNHLLPKSLHLELIAVVRFQVRYGWGVDLLPSAQHSPGADSVQA